jgi:hypothetical protein
VRRLQAAKSAIAQFQPAKISAHGFIRHPGALCRKPCRSGRQGAQLRRGLHDHQRPLSARDASPREGNPPESPFDFDWLSQKCFDGVCPLGPWLVPASDPRPARARIRLWVNDELMHDSNTGNMIFNTAEQIAMLSSRHPPPQRSRPHRHPRRRWHGPQTVPPARRARKD